MRSASGRLPGLEALRGVAAICILLLHTRAVFGGTPVFGKGYLAVEFFLMLSGFLMARTQESRLAQNPAPWRFMASRYRRLWPMMALGGVIGLPRLFLRADSVVQFLGMAATNLALLPVSFQREAFPLNIPAWTIFYELAANALHVAVLRHLGTRWLWLLMAACAAAMVWIGQEYGSFDVGARPEHFLAGLPRVLFAYLIGMILGRIRHDAPPLRAPPLPVAPLLAIPAMPLILAGGWALGWDTWLFDFGFTLIACPLMIGGALQLDRFHRAAGLFGQLSFPLFAVQMPILQGAQMLGFSGLTGSLAALGGGVVAALLASRLARWRSRRKAAAMIEVTA